MGQCVSVARCLESSVDWSDLPDELLGAILSKLSELPDYIRFGSVCKSFQSVATNRKQERRASLRTQPPLLVLVKSDSLSFSGKDYLQVELCKLYSIMEDKVYNYEFKAPQRTCDNCYFCSSRDWLIHICYSCKILGLFNPFSGKSIKTPCVDADHYYAKVISSSDHTTSPDDVVVGAICRFKHGKEYAMGLGLKKASQPSWTFFRGMFQDFIFHNGLVFALEENGRIVAFDYKKNCKDPTLIVPRHHHPNLLPSCLVEASNGDLLMVDRDYNWKFRIFKLVKEEIRNPFGNNKVFFNWIEISELENYDSIFLTFYYSRATSAFCIPNSKYHNRIYFAHTFGGQSSLCRHINHKEIGVFHLKDGTLTNLSGFHGDKECLCPLIWIMPTL